MADVAGQAGLPAHIHIKKGRITMGADCAGIGSAIEAASASIPDLCVKFITEMDDETREYSRYITLHDL